MFHKYCYKELFKYLLIISVVIVFIYILVDCMENMKHFIDHKVPFDIIVKFILLKLPYIFIQLAPVVLMLAVIIAFGVMNNSNELLAIRSSGISDYYMVKPAIRAGLLMTFGVILINELIVPVTMSQANYLQNTFVKPKRSIHRSKENIWIKQDNKILHIKYFNPADNSISGLTMTVMDHPFQPVVRIDSALGVYKGGKWHLSDLIEQKFDKKKKEYKTVIYEEKTYDIGISPEDLKSAALKAQEMGVVQLLHHIHKVESEGYDATSYRVDFFNKLAYPFLCLILSVVGAVIGMYKRIKNNMPIGVALGLVICFLYWVAHNFCLFLGYAKIFHPFISAFIAGILFCILTLILLLQSE